MRVHEGKILKFFKDHYLIFLIFMMGLGLRIYELSAESVWFDEAFSIMISKRDAFDIIRSVLKSPFESNPPLYYVALHFWVGLFGNSEFSLRFLSVLFGSVSIFGIYALGKLLFNNRAGLIAALIISLSFIHIRYAQEVRAYTMMVLLCIISFYSLIKLISQRSNSYSVLYFISSILMLYTHYYGLFIIAAQNLFCITLFLKKRNAGEITVARWVFLQLALVISFIPGFRHLLIMKSSMQKSFWITEPTLGKLGEYMVLYSGSFYLLIIFLLFTLIAVIGIKRISGVSGLKAIFKDEEDYSPGLNITYGYRVYLLALWFLAPISIPFIYSILATPMFVARYALTATLALILLVSLGIDALRHRLAVLSVAAVIAVLSLLTLKVYYNSITKPQWREVVREVENNMDFGDVFVVYPEKEQKSVKYYITREDLKVIPMRGKFPALKHLGQNSVWVVMHSHPENRRLIRQGLSGTYDFELQKPFVGLDLYKLKQK